MNKNAVKKNLTVRLAPDLRMKLEFIASKELRTLANQITVILTARANEYLSNPEMLTEYLAFEASHSADDASS